MLSIMTITSQYRQHHHGACMRAGSEARMKGRDNGRWGRGNGRTLRWAPVDSHRSCGSVDPQGTPTPKQRIRMALTIGDRSEHHVSSGEWRTSEWASSSGAHAREPSAETERSAFTEAPGDSEASDEETSAVAGHGAKDAQSAAAASEFEDDCQPTHVRGWRNDVRNTDPPAVAGEEKRPLNNSTFTDRADLGNIGYFSGIGDGERNKWADGYKEISRPKSKHPDHWLE